VAKTMTRVDAAASEFPYPLSKGKIIMEEDEE